MAEPAEAFIGVGANLAPERHIVLALKALRLRAEVTGVSTFYRTAPLGQSTQPDFINGVWRVLSPWDARTLKHGVLRLIEAALDRVRTSDPNAPRTIDLDILLFGDLVIDEPGLCIPDPGIVSRSFLAIPLLELAPGAVLPGTGAALADVAARQAPWAMEPLPVFTARLRAIAQGRERSGG